MMMVLWFQRAGSGVICVRLPVRSSSSGQYESSRDVKRYLVSALGNINHTLFGSLSLWCPLSPVVSCELLPRRPGQGCWQPMKAMQVGLCPCISLLRPQRHGPRPDGWRAGRRALAISLLLHSYCSSNRRPMSRRVEVFSKNTILLHLSLAMCGLKAYWPH